MIAALAAGAVIAAPTAALASAAPTAHSTSAAVAKIRHVPCRSWTFNVHYGYGRGREICFEGTGSLIFVLPIQNVNEITTGENTGLFRVDLAGTVQNVIFRPRETITYRPADHAALTALTIIHT
jgi:hypothetical protein